jgi:biotin carboxylase
LCTEIKIDGVTSISVDTPVPTVAYVAQGMGLIGNNYEDMLITRDKYLVRKAFEKAGVSSPLFCIAQEGGNPDLSGFKYPLIVKPTDRCASLGVTNVEKEEDLPNAIKRAQETSYSKQALIEECIKGIEVSIETISWNGKHYHLSLTDKETTGAPDHVEIAHHEPSELSVEIQKKVIAETHKALSAINFNYGASDTEIMVTEKGNVYLIEINPRMAGDYSHILTPLYNGYDIVKGVIDVALNQFEEPVFTENKYCGIYFLTKGSEWVRHYIENREKDPDIVQVELFNTENDVDRMGYFIYQSAQKRRWVPNNGK